MVPLRAWVLEGSELHWVPKVHLIVLHSVWNLVLEVSDCGLEIFGFLWLELELLGDDVYVALCVLQEVLSDQRLLIGWFLVEDSDLLLIFILLLTQEPDGAHFTLDQIAELLIGNVRVPATPRPDLLDIVNAHQALIMLLGLSLYRLQRLEQLIFGLGKSN